MNATPVDPIQQSQEQLSVDMRMHLRQLHEKCRELALLPIADATQLEAVGLVVVELATMAKSVEQAFDPHVRDANEAHKRLTRMRGQIIDTLSGFKASLSQKIVAYRTQLQREAEIAAEKERQRLQKEADDAQLEAAMAAEAAEQPELVEVILEEKRVVALPPAKAPELPRGMHARSPRFGFRILDCTKIKSAYLCPDLDKMKRACAGIKDERAAAMLIDEIGPGGVEVYPLDATLVVRT